MEGGDVRRFKQGNELEHPSQRVEVIKPEVGQQVVAPGADVPDAVRVRLPRGKVLRGPRVCDYFVPQARVFFREHPVQILDAPAAQRRKSKLVAEDEIDLHFHRSNGKGCFLLLAWFGSFTVISGFPRSSRSAASSPCMKEWSWLLTSYFQAPNLPLE